MTKCVANYGDLEGFTSSWSRWLSRRLHKTKNKSERGIHERFGRPIRQFCMPWNSNTIGWKRDLGPTSVVAYHSLAPNARFQQNVFRIPCHIRWLCRYFCIILFVPKPWFICKQSNSL